VILKGGDAGKAKALVKGKRANLPQATLAPSVELQGIVDATQGVCGGGSGPCIDPAFGPTQADYYWSATTDAGKLLGARRMDFSVGSADGYYKSTNLYVGAVRRRLVIALSLL
jgi:hypothetical protein